MLHDVESSAIFSSSFSYLSDSDDTLLHSDLSDSSGSDSDLSSEAFSNRKSSNNRANLQSIFDSYNDLDSRDCFERYQIDQQTITTIANFIGDNLNLDTSSPPDVEAGLECLFTNGTREELRNLERHVHRIHNQEEADRGLRQMVDILRRNNYNFETYSNGSTSNAKRYVLLLA